MNITCKECGLKFERRSPIGRLPKFCPTCAYKRELESNRRNKWRYRGRYKESAETLWKRHQRWKVKSHITFAFDPEAYAKFRENQRVRSLRWREKHNPPRRTANGGCYKPRPSVRIPDYCTWGSVLDVRSKWILENATPEMKDYARELFIERRRACNGE